MSHQKTWVWAWLAVAACLGSRSPLLAAGGGSLIVSNGFEASATWPLVVGTSQVTNVADGGADSPANARIRSGTFSWQSRNGSNNLELADVNMGSFTARQVVVRVASISATASSGADNPDYVNVHVAFDGAPFAAQPDARLHGNNNARWGFDATNIIHGFAGITVSNAAPQGSFSSNNYALVCIDLPNGPTSAALRVVARNSDNNEIWCLDDLAIVRDAPTWSPPATNPIPMVRFSTGELVLTESDGTQTVGVAISSSADVTVRVASAGAAVNGPGGDFILTPTTVVFTAGGPTQVLLSVAVQPDGISEGPEYATFSFVGASGALIGAPSQMVLYVRDNNAMTIMSANLTLQTGPCASQYEDPANRIFQALRPDIVAIQEFNVTNSTGRRGFVDQNFGTNFYFFVEPLDGSCSLPNGIISRWPIVDSGQWLDTNTSARDFAWASIDIPGASALHVVSVHLKAGDLSSDLSTRQQEARDLTNYIRVANFPTSDYVAVCGDLNQQSRSELALQILTNTVSDGHKPADQFGDRDSNSSRNRPYDYILPIPRLNLLHAELRVDGLTFPEGVVFDTRLWSPPPPPALAADSGTSGMQHMGVMKLFALTDTAPSLQTIGPQSVESGATLTFPVTATDAEGDAITLTASNLPAGAVFTPTNGNGTFTWTSANPVGTYTSTFYATDNDGTSLENVILSVFAPGSVWINELHYDNSVVTDTNEGVEVGGAAGVDLTPYSIVAYNGSGGATYNTTLLSGVLEDEGCGYGARWFGITGIQNGPSDAVALVRSGTVLQFLSYEGVMVASSGPAAGMTSVDIGVDEEPVPAAGQSLQLTGSGTDYANFVWSGPSTSSTGSLNAGQSILGCVIPTNQPALAPIGNHGVLAGDTLTFDVSASDPEGDVITLDVTNNPAGSVLASAGATGVFSWVNAGPVGVYTTTFFAVDNDGTNGETVLITVSTNGTLWINELHYDNASTDLVEGVEIAGAAGLDLDPYSLYAYDGANGMSYLTNLLSGILDDEGCGFGAVWFDIPGLQNGPDGIALVNDANIVIQFLSYGGAFAASNGPAAGLNSTDIGVAETPTTPAGQSLQLMGTGVEAGDFSWTDPTNASAGALNANQFIDSCVLLPTNLPALASIGDQSVSVGDTMSFGLSAFDADGDPIALSVSNAPPGSELLATNETGTFVWTNASPVGVYTSTFYAADDDGADSETVTLTVLDVACAGSNLIAEGFDASTSVPAGWTNSGTANDTDPAHVQSPTNCRALGTGDALETPAVSYPTQIIFFVDASTGGNNRTNTVEFNVNAGGYTPLGDFLSRTTGSNVIWNLTAAPDLSFYTNVRFRFSSAFNTWYLDDVRIVGGCQPGAPFALPPVIQPIANRIGTNNQPLAFEVIAYDNAEADEITLSASNLPAGAVFNAVTNAGGVTNTFSWNPAGPPGVYTTQFFAVDNDGATNAPVLITILDPPILVITTAPQIVAYAVAGFDVGGTASTNVSGEFVWTNARTGATGTIPASADWLIPGIGLGVGANAITVSGSNAFNQTATASVIITREQPLVSPCANPIFFQGFEIGDTWPIADGAANVSNETGAADFPPGQRIRSGLASWQVQQQNATLDLAQVAITGYAGRQVSMRLSSVSLTNANGSDVSDNVKIYVALDGAPFGSTAEIELAGNGNARWGFWATGVYTAAAGEFNLIDAPQGGQSSNNFAQLNLLLPDAATSVALRVTALNNTNLEIWCVDDIELVGCSLGGQPPVIQPIGDKVGTNNLALAFDVAAFDNAEADEITLSASNLPAGAVFNTVTNAGGVTNTFSWNPAGPPGVYTTQFFAVDNDGPTNVSVLITILDPPFLVITTEPQTVAYAVAIFDIGGTAGNVSGEITWTNARTGATGTIAASADWLISGIGLSVGANAITVRGSNAFSETASAGVVVTREQPLVSLCANPIFSQGFEIGDTWPIAGDAGNVSNETGVADFPPGQRIRSGLASWQVQQQNATLDLAQVVMTGYTGRQVTVRLASVSLTSGNGADASDNMNVFVALDGAPFGSAAEIALAGNGNARWGFWATGVYTAVAGDFNSVGAPQGSQSSNNYAALNVLLPDAATSVALRVTALNNTNLEIWCVDDIALVGCPIGGPPSDADGDGLLDAWEIQFFGNLTTVTNDSDFDLDTFLDVQEFLAGTVPNDSNSFLKVTGSSNAPAGEIVIEWASASNKIYLLSRSTNLLVGFTGIVSNLPATPPLNTYTDAPPAGFPVLIYRIELQ